MKDFARNTKTVVSIGAAALGADNTPTAIDRSGFETVLYQIAVGVGGIAFDTTNKIEFVLTHSDDGTNYSAVGEADVVIVNPDGTLGAAATGGIVYALTSAHATATVTTVGYVGSKRYTKLLADFSGTHTGGNTPISATVLLASAWSKPVNG
jgi:hypothetical protein